MIVGMIQEFKIRILIGLSFLFCFLLSAQEKSTNVNINIVQYKYIDNYIYIEFSITNNELHPIFVLTNL
jgi:hypothetical protein